MPDAIGLYHFRWRKKKVDGYIIPPNHFYGRVLEIPVKSPEIIHVKPVSVTPEVAVVEEKQPEKETPASTPTPKVESAIDSNVQKVSALSLSSIRAKRELEKANSAIVRHVEELPKNDFTENDMLLQWNKYAQRLGDKGYKILEALLLINDPKLQGTTIYHELPNEGSKIEFEAEKHNLLGHLRGKLHNYEITIEATVNESIENKFAFTPQDKFNRMNEINPALDVLRRTFDLDI